MAGLGLLLWLTALNVRAEESTLGKLPRVTVIHAARWSEGDPAREGAAEFMVLMEIARVRQQGSRCGLIAVGDRRGLFSEGAEEALRQAVLLGVPVVKLAHEGEVLAAPHGLFLDGRGLSEADAQQVLTRCLVRYGALGLAGASPSGRAAVKLRDQLQLFQTELSLAAGTRVATR